MGSLKYFKYVGQTGGRLRYLADDEMVAGVP